MGCKLKITIKGLALEAQITRYPPASVREIRLHAQSAINGKDLRGPPSRTKSSPNDASAWTTFEKRLLSTFSWQENSVLYRNAAIAVEFDLKCPLLARRQRRDRFALAQ
jgi:hypothetical protein